MNPATILLIIEGIQAAIKLAPEIAKVVSGSKLMIEGLVEGKLITVEQQQAIFSQIDSIAALVKAGIVPPSWQVQPDPA